MEALMVQNENLMPVMTPRQQVAKASEMAEVLQDVVKQKHLARKFGGDKEHLYFEAWQTIGQFFSCTPQTEWTKPIMDGDRIVGYEARVNVTNSDGRIIASAESMCTRDEPNWKNRPLYALRSMAQTRTAGKALRSVFAWVAVLGGYSGTPAEEMDGIEVEVKDDIPNFKPKPAPPPPPKKPEKTGSKFDFLKVMQGFKKEIGDEAYYKVLGNHGYEHANEITNRDHQIQVYKEVLKEMETGNYPKAQEPT